MEENKKQNEETKEIRIGFQMEWPIRLGQHKIQMAPIEIK